MRDWFQFGEYYRNFLTRAGWLLSQGLISHWERDKLFMSGFHIDFCQQLRTQLCLQNPLHLLDDPWHMVNVEQAARFLLEGSTSGGVLAASIPSYPASVLPPPSHAPPPRPTFDMSSIEPILTSETFLNRLAERMNPPARNGPQSSYHPASQPNSQRRSMWPCGFCSETDHMFRQCRKLDDYIQRGICIRDTTN